MKNDENQMTHEIIEPSAANENADTPRKHYEKPQLEDLGDLRALTLGISGGVGESGQETTHFP